MLAQAYRLGRTITPIRTATAIGDRKMRRQSLRKIRKIVFNVSLHLLSKDQGIPPLRTFRLRTASRHQKRMTVCCCIAERSGAARMRRRLSDPEKLKLAAFTICRRSAAEKTSGCDRMDARAHVIHNPVFTISQQGSLFNRNRSETRLPARFLSSGQVQWTAEKNRFPVSVRAGAGQGVSESPLHRFPYGSAERDPAGHLPAGFGNGFSRVLIQNAFNAQMRYGRDHTQHSAFAVSVSVLRSGAHGRAALLFLFSRCLFSRRAVQAKERTYHGWPSHPA